MAAGIYCRISNDPDALRAGVERQEADCRGLVERQGWPLVGVFVDNDASASRYARRRRPAFDSMLERVRAGEISRVVAYHVDRLYRQPRELEELVDLADKGFVTVTTLHGDIDLSTADGRMVARMLVAQSAMESDNLSRRMRRVKQAARDQGRPGGSVMAFGWIDGMTPDPIQAPIVAELFTRYLAGESLTTLARDLNARGVKQAQGGKGWTATTVRAILSGPRNAGLVPSGGKPAGEAQWPALVEREVWDRAQARLSANARVREPRRRTLLTGRVRCGVCGHVMQRDVAHNQPVWRCRRAPGRQNCGTGSIAAEPLEALTVEALLDLLERAPLARRKANAKPSKAERDALSEIADAQARLDEIADAFGDGELNRAAYNRARVRAEARIEAAQQALAGGTSRDVLRGLTGSQVRGRWDALDLDRQRAVLAAVIDRVIVKPASKRGVFDPSRVDFEFVA